MSSDRVDPRSASSGAPGAGKTTLAGSWLDARNIPGIWYQVDAGDADPATFFHYLGDAARPFTRKGLRPLPDLTAEYLSDIPGFTRRFFRELFARLPAGAALTLDNYQEVPAERPFHEILVTALDEVPPGALLVVVSRRDPPDCYTRLIANENVALIDRESLTLSVDETRRIALTRAEDLTEDEVTHLHAQCGGWAAGLTLMLENRWRQAVLARSCGRTRHLLRQGATQADRSAQGDRRARRSRRSVVCIDRRPLG